MSPRKRPMVVAIPVATKPTSMEILAPWTIRERTSRPSSSVPRGCSAEGGARIRRMSIFFGSWSVTRDGKAATTKSRAMTTPPATARRFRKSLRRKSRKMELDPAPMRPPIFRPDPGIRQRVPDVGQEIPDQGQERPDHQRPHDQGVVAGHHALVEELPESGDREDRLEDDR